MMKITISAAALISVAAFVVVPASAENLGGGPRVNADGKCWKDTGGPHDARYGTWVECPKGNGAASGVPCSAGQLTWEKAHVGYGYFDFCTGYTAEGKQVGGAGAATPASARGAAARPNNRRAVTQ